MEIDTRFILLKRPRLSENQKNGVLTPGLLGADLCSCQTHRVLDIKKILNESLLQGS